MTRLVRLIGLAALLATLPGCRDAQVATYRIPKEKDPAMPLPSAAPAGAGAMASGTVPTAGGPDLAWTAPAHWRPQPGAAMRKGSYVVPGTPPGGDADMSITAFPGDAGGLLANVNRWRAQIELAALTEAQAGAAIAHIDANQLHFDVVDFANTTLAQPQRVVAAIVPFNGSTWFFKLSGPDALVAREKAEFLRLLNTVRAP